MARKTPTPPPERPRDPRTGQALRPRQQPGYYPGFSTLAQKNYWDAATRDVVLERVNRRLPIRFFTADEERTLLAVVSRIIPQEDRLFERRIDILGAIDDRLFHNRLEGYRYIDMPPDQESYRIAIRAFEKMAQSLYKQSFHALPVLEQEKLIQSIHDGKPLAAHSEWSTLNVERFWGLLVSDCCGAYYAHPWAWDEIGFGGPAYPRGYMRLEDGEAEPWEVEECRYEWEAPSDTLSDAEEAHGTGQSHQTHHGTGGTH